MPQIRAKRRCLLFPLPDGDALCLRHEHRVVLGDAEGFVPSIDVRHLTVHAPHAQLVRVALDDGPIAFARATDCGIEAQRGGDALFKVPLSRTTGMTETYQNIGSIRNSGIEVELGGDIIRTGNLLWDATANISFLSSRVTDLYNGADIIWYDPTGEDDRAQFIYREGESPLAFYGYEWAGVDPQNGKTVWYTNNDEAPITFNGRNASYDYRDADEIVIGNAVPFATGGLSTTLRWNGFDFGAHFLFKLGGKLYDGAYKDVADDGYYWERIRAQSYYDNMWTPTHTDGSQPALSGMDLENSMQYSTRHLHNATFLRLKNLSLGYTLPRALTRRVCIQRARVYTTASNLFTLSSYHEADPEVNAFGTRGWETPLGRSFVFGIELQF